MRLIDADALKKYILRSVPNWSEDREIVLDCIANSPTIEERKKGKWIVYKAPDKYHCGLVKCPFCGEDMIAEADEYNYCPNCGSYNGGGDV